LWFFDGFRKKSKKYTSTYKFPADIQDFFDALRDCHLNHRPEYFTKLKKLAGVYPEEPVFWLFAGDVLRDKNPEKALELHRDVLFRPVTAGVFRAMVLEHIARDYMVLKQNKKAVSVLKDAVKCADYAPAALLLSEVYEAEGDYDAGLEEIKRYLSLTDPKNEAVMARYCARAANHFFRLRENDKNGALKWLSVFSKKCGDEQQTLFADYISVLINSNNKKSSEYLRKIIDLGENNEIFARSLLLYFENGSEINYGVEGAYKELFQLLFNKNLKYEGKSSNIGQETLAAQKLTVRNSLSSDFDILDTAIPDRSLFVCSECGRHLTEILPACPHCQKITGRKFKINQEV
jgi:lipopolysaccharide biosynthesis regulator YciM